MQPSPKIKKNDSIDLDFLQIIKLIHRLLVVTFHEFISCERDFLQRNINFKKNDIPTFGESAFLNTPAWTD